MTVSANIIFRPIPEGESRGHFTEEKTSREKDLNFPQGYTVFIADSEYLNESYLNRDFSA